MPSRMTKSSMFSLLESCSRSRNQRRSLTLRIAQRTILIDLSLLPPPKLQHLKRAPIEMSSSMSPPIPETLELPTSEVISLSALTHLSTILILQSLHPAPMVPLSEVTSLLGLLGLKLIPAFPMKASHPTHQRPLLTILMSLSLLSHPTLLLLLRLLMVVADPQPPPLLSQSSIPLLLTMMTTTKTLLAAPFTKMRLSQRPLELSKPTHSRKSPLTSAHWKREDAILRVRKATTMKNSLTKPTTMTILLTDDLKDLSAQKDAPLILKTGDQIFPLSVARGLLADLPSPDVPTPRLTAQHAPLSHLAASLRSRELSDPSPMMHALRLLAALLFLDVRILTSTVPVVLPALPSLHALSVNSPAEHDLRSLVHDQVDLLAQILVINVLPSLHAHRLNVSALMAPLVLKSLIVP